MIVEVMVGVTVSITTVGVTTGAIVPPTLEELRETGGVTVGETVGEKDELPQSCGVHQNIHQEQETALQAEREDSAESSELFE
ncbi:hypothetical protein HYZ98_01345 [Candidatus Peregrinibacteria bacterium]|nr:hypothetical protein [Candidatus Peregrinibacteria bacterium]